MARTVQSSFTNWLPTSGGGFKSASQNVGQASSSGSTNTPVDAKEDMLRAKDIRADRSIDRIVGSRIAARDSQDNLWGADYVKRAADYKMRTMGGYDPYSELMWNKGLGSLGTTQAGERSDVRQMSAQQGLSTEASNVAMNRLQSAQNASRSDLIGDLTKTSLERADQAAGDVYNIGKEQRAYTDLKAENERDYQRKLFTEERDYGRKLFTEERDYGRKLFTEERDYEDKKAEEQKSDAWERFTFLLNNSNLNDPAVQADIREVASLIDPSWANLSLTDLQGKYNAGVVTRQAESLNAFLQGNIGKTPEQLNDGWTAMGFQPKTAEQWALEFRPIHESNAIANLGDVTTGAGYDNALNYYLNNNLESMYGANGFITFYKNITKGLLNASEEKLSKIISTTPQTSAFRRADGTIKWDELYSSNGAVQEEVNRILAIRSGEDPDVILAAIKADPTLMQEGGKYYELASLALGVAEVNNTVRVLESLAPTISPMYETDEYKAAKAGAEAGDQASIAKLKELDDQINEFIHSQVQGSMFEGLYAKLENGKIVWKNADGTDAYTISPDEFTTEKARLSLEFTFDPVDSSLSDSHKTAYYDGYRALLNAIPISADITNAHWAADKNDNGTIVLSYSLKSSDGKVIGTVFADGSVKLGDKEIKASTDDGPPKLEGDTNNDGVVDDKDITPPPPGPAAYGTEGYVGDKTHWDDFTSMYGIQAGNFFNDTMNSIDFATTGNPAADFSIFTAFDRGVPKDTINAVSNLVKAEFDSYNPNTTNVYKTEYGKPNAWSIGKIVRNYTPASGIDVANSAATIQLGYGGDESFGTPFIAYTGIEGKNKQDIWGDPVLEKVVIGDIIDINGSGYVYGGSYTHYENSGGEDGSVLNGISNSAKQDKNGWKVYRFYDKEGNLYTYSYDYEGKNNTKSAPTFRSGGPDYSEHTAS